MFSLFFSYRVLSVELFMGRVSGSFVRLTALARLCVAVGGLGQGHADRGTAAGTALLAFALIESLAGNDAVDFWSMCKLKSR